MESGKRRCATAVHTAGHELQIKPAKLLPASD
ncbi:hypothetical protein C8E89_12755 [Mycolicibacterium moriokaense]|uniref:Uncharacterized protein n=1 Tax=Mycolicibacterium moriokaense TaxID=39691 RepID=A0A318HD95_9MYCO|nr:hypothetical protein C8E89_12755 [Mycolicibacterium moriokaense]